MTPAVGKYSMGHLVVWMTHKPLLIQRWAMWCLGWIWEDC